MNTNRSQRAWAAAWTAYGALPYRLRATEDARVQLHGGRFPGLNHRDSIRLLEQYHAADAAAEKSERERSAKATRQTVVMLVVALSVVAAMLAWALLGGFDAALNFEHAAVSAVAGRNGA